MFKNEKKISGLFFALHTYCNFDCSYCWQKNKGYNLKKFKLSENKVEEILNYFFENYFIFYPKDTEINFIFSGGEGLFFQEEIINYINLIYSYRNVSLIKPKIIIQTNGSILNDELIKIFKKFNIILHISYDGTAQNITRKNSKLILNNIQTLLNNNIKINIVSIYEPETIQYLYSSYLLLKEYNVNYWSFGLNFLKEKTLYDTKILKNELSKIYLDYKNNKNILIKNFYQIENSNSWKKSLFNNIHEISITPFGDFHPTNYKYNLNSNISFGNISQGFNENEFSKYLNNKYIDLKPIKFKDENINIDNIIYNLFE